MINTYEFPDGRTAYGATKQDAIATLDPASSITSASLVPTPSFKTQAPKPATGTDGALAYLLAQGEQTAKGFQEQAAQREKQMSDFIDDKLKEARRVIIKN